MYLHICISTHPYLWHDSFVCVTWLICMCDMTHPYVWHDSFVGEVRGGADGLCGTCLTHMCDVPHFYVCHNSFVCMAWLIRICYMNHSFVSHDSSIDGAHGGDGGSGGGGGGDSTHVWHASFLRATWLIHLWQAPYVCVTWLIRMWSTQWQRWCMWDMPRLYLRYVSFLYVTWLIRMWCTRRHRWCMWDMLRLYLWYASFLYVTWLIRRWRTPRWRWRRWRRRRRSIRITHWLAHCKSVWIPWRIHEGGGRERGKRWASAGAAAGGSKSSYDRALLIGVRALLIGVRALLIGVGAFLIRDRAPWVGDSRLWRCIRWFRLQVSFCKRAITYGALLRKGPVKIRHPMHICHPVVGGDGSGGDAKKCFVKEPYN